MDAAAPTPQVLRGRVVTPTAVIDDGAVIITADRITWVGSWADIQQTLWAGAVADVEHTDGAHILPGLVDVHNHGGGGASFPDATTREQAMIAITEHRFHGTTSLVASAVTAPAEILLTRVALLADLAEAGELAGIHLEGPFLAANRCGAQNPADMLDGDPALTQAILDAGRGYVRTMTVAPDVPGIIEVINTLIAGGALPSIGHTDASAEQTTAAINAASAALAGRERGSGKGRITATHLFNGMRPLHHRDPGPIAACLAAAARGQIAVELVGDGTHLAPATVSSVFDMVGPGADEVGHDAVILVTDAMAAAGMPDGEYQLGPMSVTVADSVARLTGGDAIAGGTAHLLDVVRCTVAAGVDLAPAVRAASFTPASVLGLDDVGGLVAGRRADILVTDADLRPVRVLRSGKPI